MMLALESHHVALAPSVYASARLVGVVRRRDLARLSRASARAGLPILITGASCDYLDGKLHHLKVGTYDLRSRWYTTLERERLTTALQAELFDVVYEPTALHGPHLHISAFDCRACDHFAHERAPPMEKGDHSATSPWMRLFLLLIFGFAAVILGVGVQLTAQGSKRLYARFMPRSSP